MPGGHDYPGPAHSLAAYHELVEASNVETVVRGAKNPYTSRNGHMFSFLTPEGMMALRLPDELGAQFQQQHGGGPVTQYGSVMRGYVGIPAELLASPEDLARWFEAAWEWIGTLPPKPTTK